VALADDDSDDFSLTGERQRLLQGKLGALLFWRVPQLIQTVGPFDPSAFDPYDKKRRKLIDACVERLGTHSDEQISEIVQNWEERAKDPHGWRKFLTDDIHTLKSKIPEWYIGGFGHPDHVADFDYWTKMLRFDVSELTCLTVGINPNEFSARPLMDLSSSIDRGKFCRPLEFLIQRYEQLQRAFGHHNVYQKDFIQWATQFEFEVHPGFIGPMKRFHAAAKAAVETIPPQKPDQREIDKIAQLFTALAIDALGYVPSQHRSPVPKEICEIAASMGLSVSEDTVRKYLRSGASFIPADWKPNQR